MAGRIQLTTTGIQDVYFTENPDYSYFVQLFRKHTNYTSQFVKLDMDNDVEFGQTVRITIPKDQGDLVKTISLEVELDKIEGADVTRYGYVESIGHAMIDYIDMYIGNEKIQHIPSDYLQIYSEQNFTQTKQKALEKLVGKYPDRTSDVPVSSGVILGHLGPATKTIPLYIDIPFYFYRKPELAIPLCAMCYQEVTLEIKFRDLKHCLVKTDPPVDTSLQTTTLDYEVSSSTVVTSDASTEVVGVSHDGNTIASIVNNTIEIAGKTTFGGTGVVSPGMNVIVTNGSINRYDNGQWNPYSDSTININNDIRFSDDGNVLIEVGTGLWIWNGSGYTHSSVTGVLALSRDGNFYLKEPSQNGPNLEIRNVSTDTRLGGVIVKPSNTAVNDAHLSYDGTKLLFVINDILFVYQYSTDWLRYGQDVGLYETGEITFTKDGNSFFIYNLNERYDITTTPVKQGIGYLYIYDTRTTQWVQVFRYTGAGGTFSFMNDTNLKIFVKRSNGTDAITLKELTRSVEGYDEVVVKSIENIVDSGSNVFGGGYQSLVSEIVDDVLFNENTLYSVNNTDFLEVGPADDIEISNNGIVTCILYNILGQFRVYKRLSDLSALDRMNFNGQAGLTVGGITFSKATISASGRYIAVEDRQNGRVYIYETFTNEFRNIQYVDGATPNILAFISISTLKGVKFYDNESKIILYGGDEIKIFDVSSTMTLSQTITDTSTPLFNHSIISVSKDLDRFIKYDSPNNVVKIMTINQDNSIVSSLPIVPLTQVIAFDLSKDGTLAAFVTSGFTYIYSYDGFGWKQKSSLFIGIQTFKKFHMSDDGNTLTYVKTETVPNLTIIELYQYINNTWLRIHQENDNSTVGTLGIGAVSFNNHFLYSLRSSEFIRRSTRIKKIIKQQTASIVGVDQDISQVYPKQVLSCKLSLEMVFLDKYERAIIKNKKQDYVLSQLQHNRFLAPKSIETHNFRTSFLNPVKELYFVIKRLNKEEYLDFVSPFDYDNDKITSENKLIFYENLKSTELLLNDTQVLDKDTGNFAFLKAIQPAIHHSKTPLIRRFYTYSFCMEPEQHFPTGQVNFSLVNNQLFTFNLTENTTSDRHVDIYALSYNILRLDKGMMRVMFNTT